jgi:hypothetical protein
MVIWEEERVNVEISLYFLLFVHLMYFILCSPDVRLHVCIGLKGATRVNRNVDLI